MEAPTGLLVMCQSCEYAGTGVGWGWAGLGDTFLYNPGDPGRGLGRTGSRGAGRRFRSGRWSRGESQRPRSTLLSPVTQL